jgi:hypothetical protein
MKQAQKSFMSEAEAGEDWVGVLMRWRELKGKGEGVTSLFWALESGKLANAANLERGSLAWSQAWMPPSRMVMSWKPSSCKRRVGE